MPDFDGVVLWRKIEIGYAGNQNGLGLGGGERRFEIAAVARVGVDVAVLPGPKFCQQITRVPVEMIFDMRI